jgi:AraC family transcriptional regulator, regulatory protein of adaptative response / methylated-DNA-[protein]-cysteine methyltransferase
MLIQKPLKLIPKAPPPSEGRGLSLTLFRGTSSIAPYIGLAQGAHLVALGFVGSKFSEAALEQDLCHRPSWRQASVHEEEVRLEHLEALEIWGTPFQLKVWEALYALPRTRPTTYKDLAHQVGLSCGFQAVGQAVSRNPISVLIPCHLVINSSGTLGEYYWGKELKEKLLSSLPQSVL